jgi:hypothetical protein
MGFLFLERPARLAGGMGRGLGGPAAERGLASGATRPGSVFLVGWLELVGVEGAVFYVARVLDLAHVDDFGAAGFGVEICQLGIFAHDSCQAHFDSALGEAEPFGNKWLWSPVNEMHRCDFDLARRQFEL